VIYAKILKSEELYHLFKYITEKLNFLKSLKKTKPFSKKGFSLLKR